MTSFKFRLETLLKLRCADRDQRRAQLAQAYHAEQVIRDNAHDVAQQQQQLAQDARQASRPGVLDADRLLGMHRHHLVLQAQATTLRRQHEQLRPEIQRRRDALMHADQQVRVLEKLKEKQLERHLDRQRKLEVKRLDEVAGRVAAVEGQP